MKRLPFVVVLVWFLCLPASAQMSNEEIARLRSSLRLPDDAVVTAALGALPRQPPTKLFLRVEGDTQARTNLIQWVSRWNKQRKARSYQVELVTDHQPADLVVVWITNDAQRFVREELRPMRNPLTAATPREVLAETFVPAFGYLLTPSAEGIKVVARFTGNVRLSQPKRHGIELKELLFRYLAAPRR